MPLAIDLELAVDRGDEGQHAVGLAQIEARQDDRIGRIAARDGHRPRRYHRAGSDARSGSSAGLRRPARTAPKIPRDPVIQNAPLRTPVDAGAVASPAPASTRAARVVAPAQPSTGYLRVQFRVHFPHDDDGADRPRPRRADRRHEGGDRPARREHDPSTHRLYEMVRYHLGLDGSGASAASGCGRCSGSSPTRRSRATTGRAAGCRGCRARSQLQPRP